MRAKPKKEAGSDFGDGNILRRIMTISSSKHIEAEWEKWKKCLKDFRCLEKYMSEVSVGEIII